MALVSAGAIRNTEYKKQKGRERRSKFYTKLFKISHFTKANNMCIIVLYLISDVENRMNMFPMLQNEKGANAQL